MGPDRQRRGFGIRHVETRMPAEAIADNFNDHVLVDGQSPVCKSVDERHIAQLIQQARHSICPGVNEIHGRGTKKP